MKQFALITLALVTLSALPCQSEPGDHLEPVEGYFSSYRDGHDYHSAIRRSLANDAVKSPATMITLPSFQPESIVFLKTEDGRSVLISGYAKKLMWLEEGTNDVDVIWQEKEIDSNVADLVSQVFALATSESRYPEQVTLGLDGVSFYFGSFVRGVGIRAGQTWSPKEGTICRNLVTLGQSLQGYVEDEVTREDISDQAEELLGQLRKDSNKNLEGMSVPRARRRNAVTRTQAVIIAAEASRRVMQIPSHVEPQVEQTAGTFVITYPMTLSKKQPPMLAPAYYTKVTVDRRTGKMLELLTAQ